MTWNWEQPDWPAFRYNAAAVEPLEKQFLLRSGEFIGACKHIGSDDRDALKIELISGEALKTSEIEGEILIGSVDEARAAPRQMGEVTIGNEARTEAEVKLDRKLSRGSVTNW